MVVVSIDDDKYVIDSSIYGQVILEIIFGIWNGLFQISVDERGGLDHYKICMKMLNVQHKLKLERTY